MHLVVMGVTASGKTTVARMLARRFAMEFADADDYHPPASVTKMRAGTPLDDADREPWLTALTRWIADREQRGDSTVLACSALRRTYRDRLREAAPDVNFAYLQGSQALFSQRMTRRENHFMPHSLLESQFATLEEPAPDEGVFVVDATESPAHIADRVAARYLSGPAAPASVPPGHA